MGEISTYPPQNVSAQNPVLGYAEVNANQTGIGSTPVDLTGLSVTVTVPAGRRLRITGKAQVVEESIVAGGVLGTVQEGTTVLGRWYRHDIGASEAIADEMGVIVSPTAGTHTYKLVLAKNVGTGSVQIQASSTNPAYILVEDITGSQLPVLPQSVPVGVLARSEYNGGQIALGAGITDLPAGYVNVNVPAGRLLKVSVFACLAGGTYQETQIFEDGVKINRYYHNDSAGEIHTHSWSIYVSPSAGQHTYSAKIALQAAGTLFSDAGNESYIVVEDVTPTPAPGQGAPGSTLAFNTTSTGVGSITTTYVSVGPSVTVTVPAGRRLRIWASVSALSTVDDDVLRLAVYENGVATHSAAYETVGGWGTDQQLAWITTPSAGTYTWSLYLKRDSGSGTVTFQNGVLLIEDITGSVWPVGSTVTAGMIASEALGTYTPAVSNITVGNGVLTGYYIKFGRMVFGFASFAFGTTSSNPSGRPGIGAPFAKRTGWGGVQPGYFLDGGATEYPAIARWMSDTIVEFVKPTTSSNGVVLAGDPFTFGNGDIISVTWMYEAAS